MQEPCRRALRRGPVTQDPGGPESRWFRDPGVYGHSCSESSLSTVPVVQRPTGLGYQGYKILVAKIPSCLGSQWLGIMVVQSSAFLSHQKICDLMIYEIAHFNIFFQQSTILHGGYVTIHTM